MFPYELVGLRFTWRTHMVYAVLGGVLGAIGGVSGAVIMLALMLGVPVLLIGLLVVAGFGGWYAVRRQDAGFHAWTFALALGLAQWPFTVWRWPDLMGNGPAAPAGLIVLVTIAGLAIAPVCISVVRSQLAGVNNREHG